MTLENLKTKTHFKDLPEDVLNSFVTNAGEVDEKVIDAFLPVIKKFIDTTTMTIHSGYDQDVKDLTGNAKPEGVKSFDHVKNELKRLKGLAESAGDTSKLKEKNKELSTEISTLRDQLKTAGGADKVLKSEYESLEQKYKDLQGEKETLSSSFETFKSEKENEVEKYKNKTNAFSILTGIDSYITTEKLAYDDTIKKELFTDILSSKRESFAKNYTVDEIDANGKKIQVLRNKDGDIVRDSNAQPYTPGALFYEQNKPLFKEGKSGGGAGGSASGENRNGTLDLSGAKLKGEAVGMIQKHIMQIEGISKLDPKFPEREKELIKENKVMEMPDAV